MNDIQPSFICVYALIVVTGNEPVYTRHIACWRPTAPKPPVIGVAVSDAQAAVGVCWYIPAGKKFFGRVFGRATIWGNLGEL